MPFACGIAMEVDHRGNFIASSQTYTPAHDLAGFGLLLQQDGVWAGQRVLPDGWLYFLTTPAPLNRHVALTRTSRGRKRSRVAVRAA